MKIGSVHIKNKLAMAPMAAISDLGFRVLCKRAGVGLVYSEMINAMAVVRKNRATLRLAKSTEEEKPVTMQLFGTKPEILKKAGDILIKDFNADIIDINMGCPKKDLINIGAGAALLKRPAKIKEIFDYVNFDVPFTTKIRIDSDLENTLKTIKILENNVDAICVHARTRGQDYSVKADWDALKKIKDSTDLPIIGNGDIDESNIADFFLKTGCDMAMIGRAARGDPGIFARILGKPYKHNWKQIVVSYKQIMDENKVFDFAKFKNHAVWFTKGINGSKALRLRISRAKSPEEIIKSFK